MTADMSPRKHSHGVADKYGTEGSQKCFSCTKKPYDRCAEYVEYTRECEEVEVHRNHLKILWIAVIAHIV